MPSHERFPRQKPAVPTKKKRSSKRNFLLIIFIILVVLGVGVFFSPWSPLAVKQPPKGPELSVGDNRYVYACSVMDAGKTASTLHVNGDTGKENIQEEYAFDPTNTTDKKVDLLALTGSDSAASTCRLKFDRVYVDSADKKKVASFINVTASLVQFKDTTSAQKAYDDAKATAQKTGALQELPTQGKDSYYAKPVAAAKGSADPTYIRPNMLYKNMVIKLSAPLAADDSDGSKMASQLATVVKDIKSRIETGDGNTITDHSNITKVGKTPYADACSTIDYRKLAAGIDGGIELNPTSTQAIQGFAPDDVTLPGVQQAASNCSFTFRTPDDRKAQKGLKDTAATPADKAQAFNNKYPHYFNARLAAVENDDAAKKYISSIKQQTQATIKQNSAQNTSSITVEDKQMGDSAIEITTTPKNVAKNTSGTYDSQVYYVAKGSYVYQFSTYFTRQTKPYRTTSHKLSDQEMQPIITLFSNAVTLAAKK